LEPLVTSQDGLAKEMESLRLSRPLAVDPTAGIARAQLIARLSSTALYTAQSRVGPARAEPTEATSLNARSNLPEELRGKLRNVVIALDVNRIAGFIRLVSCKDASLGATLAERAGRFCLQLNSDWVGRPESGVSGGL
jgi:hypothetical protein